MLANKQYVMPLNASNETQQALASCWLAAYGTPEIEMRFYQP